MQCELGRHDEHLRALFPAELRARADQAVLARLPGLFAAWDVFSEGDRGPVEQAFTLLELADEMSLLRSAWRAEELDSLPDPAGEHR